MNYVILNGVDSRNITGLLIQSLPPISKPLMRTSIEEIDGRDGDIITELGYSAYDKEMLIGLHGSFNINQIIAYFASAGKVVFSNEPDKYYNYTIIAQIDFERLIRYRTATVTFHVQPFKYSATETPIVDTNPSVSLSVTNSGNCAAKPKITIYGSGTVNLSLNGNQIFVISLSTNDYITIDAAEMEAYKGNTLENRLVTGEYENFVLPVGTNTITWSGTVTEIDIENYSRWI